MNYWSFATESFSSPEAKAEARATMSRYLEADSPATFRAVLRSLSARSIVRVGDIEAKFLVLPFIKNEKERKLILDNIGICGMDPRNLHDPREFYQVLLRADLVLIQPPLEGCERFWAGTFEAFRAWALFQTGRKFIDVHQMYYAFHEGLPLKALAGKRVAIVGPKAGVFFEHFYRSEDYRRTFPFLGLESIELIPIGTPDLPDYCMNHFEKVSEAVRCTYDRGIDAYLFSLGILAKYLAVMVQEEQGALGWDIGSSLDIMMGLRSERLHLCGPFHRYRHPRYELVTNGLGAIIEIKPREQGL